MSTPRVSARESDQFAQLDPDQQELIYSDIARNGVVDDGTPLSINFNNRGKAITGPVFASDTGRAPAAVGPLSVAPILTPQEAPAPVGPLAQVTQAAQPPARGVDMASMLQGMMPQEDQSSKWLALAAGLGAPTKSGTFGETVGNVASAMQSYKAQQEKLRSQYIPLIMQQVAAQQAREEQAAYRQEAQLAAQQAARAAQQERLAQSAAQAELARQQQAAIAEENRTSREAIAAENNAARSSLSAQRKEDSLRPPQGYDWGPADADGKKTLYPVKGGPADTKLAGVFNTDTAMLTNSISAFDRLATSANEVLNHPGLPGITGLRGALPNIPGGDAANAQSLLATLKSQVGFGVLQDMRNNSKTGGALGAVSDAEGKRLENNLAALEKAQSLEQFQAQLKKIVDYAQEAKDRMRSAFNLKHPDSAPPTPAQPPTPGTDLAAAAAAERARRAALKK